MSYFSNFIEGTRFTVEQATDIVFNGVVPEKRPQDAHDIQGTYELIYPPAFLMFEHRRAPKKLIALLQTSATGFYWTGRSDAAPGLIQDAEQPSRGPAFVDWTLVEGTFREGLRFYLGLPDGLRERSS